MAIRNSTQNLSTTEPTMTLVTTQGSSLLSTSTSSPSNIPHISLFSVCPILGLIIIITAVVLCKKVKKHNLTLQNRRQMAVSKREENIPQSTLVISQPLLLTKPDPQTRWQPLQEMRSSVRTWRQKQSVLRSWSSSFSQTPSYSLQDVSLLEMIKDGKQGRFYRAKMSHGNCKGHKLITCKVIKEGVSLKRFELEVSILKKVGYHKHVLQLLDWEVAQRPYMLFLENVSFGTLRKFLRINRVQLTDNENLQSLLTVVAYHVALGMEHISNKMVLHRDLALRNILIGSFPYECKITEFGLASDLFNYRSSWKHYKSEVPLRWYPPEYFREKAYHLKSEVWSYGILLWEMETLGCSPYPDLDSAEEVMFHVCNGYRMRKPRGCRDEIYKLMEQCWTENARQRPSFSEIAKYLEDIVEEDADYIQVEESKTICHPLQG
ncbi:fibroblast growth factor receptor homolog 1 isoform X2 [Microcaecilia unicolor]|uniref:Fibroblast growth factor receptor homolog 1-like isoform X2 n=1 Tax=Microcaecilia unicolor TaxID=1415580 RepID=A0A6P7ZW01_9AMPH|nr:fibroblast growth factor receptor homolog 1-like isoform X2 [Microcaecilia unicolor]